jgi:hypothetical protein
MTRRNGVALSVLLLWMCSGKSLAAIQTAASCLQADVSAAILIANNGDTVNVPGGCSASWSNLIIPTSKGITLAGGSGGGTTTISTSAALIVNSNGTTTTRITGFTFTSAGTTNDGDIHVSGSSSSSAYRIDHNTFTNSAQSVFVVLDGNGPGLLDHNTFNGGAASEIIHNVALGASSNSGWTNDVIPGGSNMVFIEDNTFNCTASSFFCSGVQSYYGAQTVVRHNTLNYTQIDQHGTPGGIGARWFELYENTFFPEGRNQSNYFDIRAGSGLIYNNHESGANTGAGTVSLHEEDSGTWPLAYQVGSGINGQNDQHSTCSSRAGTSGVTNSNPVYIWGNDAAIKLDVSQSPSLVQLNRDFFVSSAQPAILFRHQTASDTCATTYSYTPYPYPHPLQGSTATPPGPPASATAKAQ